MVSTKLPTLSRSTILPKLMLRRSIPFGSSCAYEAYGYEKLSNENENQSLIASMNLYDSYCSSSNGPLHDVDVPANDNFTAVGSVSSVLFSVGSQSMSYNDNECSYSYSLCSDPYLGRGPSRGPLKQSGEDGGIINTADYSKCMFDKSTSRNAGLDYNGRTLPKDANSSVKATIASHDDLHKESLQRTNADLFEGGRTVKENVGAITCHQLEKTFDSDINDDFSTSAKLLPGNIRSVTDGRKEHRVRKWLKRRILILYQL
ncbi:hypothetical protein QTG54_009330 [Skeletonema marinoi]|uniref:Uncharacterized protein n=1 Tax=Skeletonema marinoi TaxID=267567 RepID=A0AAD8Y775_9STRA|nr:hypothetical protein QTG54_009330 [Skeletonema marinoi]